MKTVKHILTSVFLVLGLVSFAQVGVGTQDPSTTLDVVGVNSATTGALAAKDGVTVPRVSTDMTGSPVDGTTAGQLVYSTANTGFYFWDGNSWEPVGGSASSSEVTLGSITDVDISSNATIPSTGQVFNLINGAGFGGPTVTLPVTSASDAGKLLTIINLNPTTTINLANVSGGNVGLGGNKSGLFISNGSTWILIVED